VGQPGDECAERLPVGRVQVLIVQVDPGVLVLLHQRHDRSYLRRHQLR